MPTFEGDQNCHKVINFIYSYSYVEGLGLTFGSFPNRVIKVSTKTSGEHNIGISIISKTNVDNDIPARYSPYWYIPITIDIAIKPSSNFILDNLVTFSYDYLYKSPSPTNGSVFLTLDPFTCDTSRGCPGNGKVVSIYRSFATDIPDDGTVLHANIG
jgi:hypothetical protein